MKWFRNLKTSVKLMSGFALVGVIMGLMGWLGIRNMSVVNANVEGLYQEQLLPAWSWLRCATSGTWPAP